MAPMEPSRRTRFPSWTRWQDLVFNGTRWWHPREKFIKILVDAFNAKIEERNKEDGPAKLEFLQGWELSKMDRVSSGGGYSFDVVLRSKSNSGEQVMLTLSAAHDAAMAGCRRRWAEVDSAREAGRIRWYQSGRERTGQRRLKRSDMTSRRCTRHLRDSDTRSVPLGRGVRIKGPGSRVQGPGSRVQGPGSR
eukprot:3604776-Rhodomonas_salina.1